MLFADAVKIFCRADEQVPVGDGNRRLDGCFICFGFEDDFEFVTAGVEHNDFSGLVDAVKFSVGAGE